MNALGTEEKVFVGSDYLPEFIYWVYLYSAVYIFVRICLVRKVSIYFILKEI